MLSQAWEIWARMMVSNEHERISWAENGQAQNMLTISAGQ